MSVKEEFLAKIKEYIRPFTDPVAIKLVFDDTPIPEKAIRPGAKFGGLTFCQGVSAARRNGMTLAYDATDNGCPPASAAFGLIPGQDTLLAGTVCVGAYAGSVEAAQKIEGANVLLEPGKLKYLLIGPYEKVDWEPDVVLVYGNSAQMARMAQGYAFYTGDGVKSYSLGRLACAGYINKVFVNQEPTIVIPGGGERVFGTTEDDELIFALPVKDLETTANGVEGVHKAGFARFPTFFAGITCSPKMPGKYMKAFYPKK